MSTALDLRPSEGDSAVKFVERVCVHGEGDFEGQKPVLREDQKELIWEWFERDEDGFWQFVRMYYEACKGDGKTMLFAWLVILHFLGPTGPLRPNVVVSANSKEQAGEQKGEDPGDGIFGRIVQVLKHENCVLGQFVDILEDRIVRKDGMGRIMLRAANAKSADGGLTTLYVADEVQDWSGNKAEAHQRNENSTNKTDNGRSMSCSTPGGYKGKPVVGWRLHAYGEKVRSGAVDDPHFLYRSQRAEEHWDLDNERERRCALRQANPGIRKRQLTRLSNRYHEIPKNDFCRFHLGWWMEAEEDSWLVDFPGAWAACEDHGERIPIGAAIVIAIDMAHSQDSAAILYGWRNPDTGRVVVRCRLWTPSAGKTVPRGEIRKFLRDLRDDYTITGVSYDPYFFETDAEELSAEMPMIETPQSMERMIPACAKGLEAIVNTVIAHDGHAELADMISAAARIEVSKGWRLAKGRSRRHIDGAIAFVLLVAELIAQEQNVSIYETQGLK